MILRGSSLVRTFAALVASHRAARLNTQRETRHMYQFTDADVRKVAQLRALTIARENIQRQYPPPGKRYAPDYWQHMRDTGRTSRLAARMRAADTGHDPRNYVGTWAQVRS